LRAATSHVTLALGEKAGFFQKEGFQPELIRIRSTIALALVSGEIDYQSVVAPGIAAAQRTQRPHKEILTE
jgi:ABC-type nitrate/sulfonate/bicarbonate transport system substrate-binding protein